MGTIRALLELFVRPALLLVRYQWYRLERWLDDVLPCSACESVRICERHQRRCVYCGCAIDLADQSHYGYKGQYWCSSNCFYADDER